MRLPALHPSVGSNAPPPSYLLPVPSRIQLHRQVATFAASCHGDLFQRAEKALWVAIGTYIKHVRVHKRSSGDRGSDTALSNSVDMVVALAGSFAAARRAALGQFSTASFPRHLFLGALQGYTTTIMEYHYENEQSQAIANLKKRFQAVINACVDA